MVIADCIIVHCGTCTASHSTHTHTELQLAALLGKTLLEKNAELEQNLRRLQDFAEEAVADNEVYIYMYIYIYK